MAYEDTELADDGEPGDALSRLPDDQAKTLARRCANRFASDPRKVRAWKRWLVYTENFKNLILERIETTHSDAETKEEIAKHADLTNNVALDITRDTSVCWKQGVRRTLADATERQQQAFRAIEIESMIDVHAVKWNQIAEFVGPIVVIPQVKRERLTWDVLLPTSYDVEPDPDDPSGCPIAVAYSLRCDGRTRRSRDKADTVVLDGWSWRYYTTANGTAELLDEVPHELGYFPGEPLRFDHGYDDDWFGGCRRNQRTLDATVSICTLNAGLSFVRKAQNKNLLAIIGDTTGLPKLQKLDPELPVMMEAAAGERMDVTALPFDTSPENFIAHAEFILRQVASSKGGTVTDDGKGGRRVTFDDGALTEIRNEQLPFARAFERGLWAKAVAICHAMKRPGFEDLPDPDDVRANLQLDFGKLARRFADPKQEADYIDWLLSKGATDQVELTRRIEGSNLSDEQVWSLLDRRLENQARFNDAVTKRNLGMNADQSVMTAAQANGALGPAAKNGTPVTVQVPVPVDGEAPADTAALTDGEQPPETTPDGEQSVAAPTAEDGSAISDVQAQALNGAQIASFLELAMAFANGTLPFELGERFLPVAFPGVIRNEAAARRILEPLRGFTPRPIEDVKNPPADAGSADAEGNDDGERAER